MTSKAASGLGQTQLPGLSYPHCPSLTLSPSSSSTRSPCSCLRPSHHLSFSMLFAWVSACFPPALCSAHFLTEAFSDLLTDHFDFLLLAGLPSLSTSSMGQGLVCLPHRCQGERGTPWALALQHCGRKEGKLENQTSVHPRQIKCWSGKKCYWLYTCKMNTEFKNLRVKLFGSLQKQFFNSSVPLANDTDSCKLKSSICFTLCPNGCPVLLS